MTRWVVRPALLLLTAAGAFVVAANALPSHIRLQSADAINSQLRDAAIAGNLEWLTQAVDEGAEIDSRTASGGTALYWAAGSRNLPAVQLLLSRHADPFAIDLFGNSPLDAAAAVNHVDILRVLLDAMPAWDHRRIHRLDSALRAAAGRGHYEAAEFLIKQGARASATIADHPSALALARDCGDTRPELIELLLRSP